MLYSKPSRVLLTGHFTTLSTFARCFFARWQLCRLRHETQRVVAVASLHGATIFAPRPRQRVRLARQMCRPLPAPLVEHPRR